MHKGATELRRHRAQSVKELRAQGLSTDLIALKLDISRSYVWELTNDPDGLKTRRRKESYGKSCRQCGRRTSGANGRDKAAELCGDCHRRLQRYWTRERIIDAIRAWAAQHGRPPSSSEWIRASASPGIHPARTNVYQSSNGWNAPFRYWADAVEAAGFPRPLVGHYERKKTTVRRRVARPSKGFDPNKAKLLRDKGWSDGAIARHFGVARQTVKRHLGT